MELFLDVVGLGCFVSMTWMLGWILWDYITGKKDQE